SPSCVDPERCLCGERRLARTARPENRRAQATRHERCRPRALARRQAHRVRAPDAGSARRPLERERRWLERAAVLQDKGHLVVPTGSALRPDRLRDRVLGGWACGIAGLWPPAPGGADGPGGWGGSAPAIAPQ